MGDYYTTGGDLDKSILACVATLYCSFFALAGVYEVRLNLVGPVSRIQGTLSRIQGTKFKIVATRA